MKQHKTSQFQDLHIYGKSMVLSWNPNNYHTRAWYPIQCLCRNMETDSMFMFECGNQSK